mmetsp:Transcript_610/g.1823  ORF Transcript_610/g.1823 Transcript_610/m.1823 type:complete len:389 (-) Transcript_610:2233-3399(-)
MTPRSRFFSVTFPPSHQCCRTSCLPETLSRLRSISTLAPTNHRPGRTVSSAIRISTRPITSQHNNPSSPTATVAQWTSLPPQNQIPSNRLGTQRWWWWLRPRFLCPRTRTTCRPRSLPSTNAKSWPARAWTHNSRRNAKPWKTVNKWPDSRYAIATTRSASPCCHTLSGCTRNVSPLKLLQATTPAQSLSMQHNSNSSCTSSSNKPINSSSSSSSKTTSSSSSKATTNSSTTTSNTTTNYLANNNTTSSLRLVSLARAHRRLVCAHRRWHRHRHRFRLLVTMIPIHISPLRTNHLLPPCPWQSPAVAHRRCRTLRRSLLSFRRCVLLAPFSVTPVQRFSHAVYRPDPSRSSLHSTLTAHQTAPPRRADVDRRFGARCPPRTSWTPQAS